MFVGGGRFPSWFLLSNKNNSVGINRNRHSFINLLETTFTRRMQETSSDRIATFGTRELNDKKKQWFVFDVISPFDLPNPSRT